MSSADVQGPVFPDLSDFDICETVGLQGLTGFGLEFCKR